MQRRSFHLQKQLAPLRRIYAHGFFGYVFDTVRLRSLLENAFVAEIDQALAVKRLNNDRGVRRCDKLQFRKERGKIPHDNALPVWMQV